METKRIKVTVCCRLPVKAYFGGIATIVKKYMDRADLFSAEEVELSLFDFHDEKAEAVKNQKLRNILYWKSFSRAARAYCKQNRPDLFHIHTARELLFLRDVLVGASIARSYHIKCALTIHVGAASTVFNRIPKPLHKYLINCLNKYFSHVFFLSEEIMSSFVAMGLRQEICSVLYNFHDMPSPSEKKCDPEFLRCLFVGAIQREKGIIELMNAFDALKNGGYRFHLDICGLINDSSVQQRFDEFCKNNKDFVTAHGYVTGSEKERLFSDADVLILPSYHEGMPLVVLEALASGCAVISTRVGTTPEILGEENALWVEIGDEKALANAIFSLASDPARLKAMQKANLQLADKFALKTHVKDLCSIYRSIVLSKKGED